MIQIVIQIDKFVTNLDFLYYNYRFVICIMHIDDALVALSISVDTLFSIYCCNG